MHGETDQRSFGSGARACLAWLAPLWLTSFSASCAHAIAPPARAHAIAPVAAVQDPAGEDLAALQAMLARSGPDGREAREAAIERLLASPRPAAHAVLCGALAATDDRDDVRAAVAVALQRHLQLAPAQQFGGMAPAARAEVAKAYLLAALPIWRTDQTPAPEAFAQAARMALQRWPARELEAAARATLASGDTPLQAATLRCLADLQQTYFAATLADWIESPDMALKQAAQEALQTLTCHEEPIRTRAAFAAWQQRFGGMRYVDLAERAARRGVAPLERMKVEMAQLRIQAARDVVRAHVARGVGVDWKAVQDRVVVDDPATLDACLELLQQGPPIAADDASPARLAFVRALMQRFRAEPPERSARRALLLEVSAGLSRAEDGELAKELIGLLVAQLEVADKDVQVAALRGLRRFPTPETRARLATMARRLLAEPLVARELVAAVLKTLAARTEPRWPAPSPADADKADWLQLVAMACRSDEALDLRSLALELASTRDARDQRVPEVFQVLLELVRDTSLATAFRSTAAIQMQDWRAEKAFAGAWLAAQHELLADPAVELRKQAAAVLAAPSESNDADRAAAIRSTILAVRGRLLVETEAKVVEELGLCLQACGRSPESSELAIGAIRMALGDLTRRPAADQQLWLAPLLQALSGIAADVRTERDQWLLIADDLVTYKRRQSLRMLLTSHNVVDLAKDLGPGTSPDEVAAAKALTKVLDAALLKPDGESWTASAELRREAEDVLKAFSALDRLPAERRPDSSQLRLLRLDVELALGESQTVAQRAVAWLDIAAGNGTTAPGGAGTPTNASSAIGGAAQGVRFSLADRDRLRRIAAEARFTLGQLEAARKLLEECVGDDGPEPAARELEAKVARALVATDLRGAVALFERAFRRTPVGDPAFRGRLLEWAQGRLRLAPELREETLQVVAPHAALFEAADCPDDLKRGFAQLRAGG